MNKMELRAAALDFAKQAESFHDAFTLLLKDTELTVNDALILIQVEKGEVGVAYEVTKSGRKAARQIWEKLFCALSVYERTLFEERAAITSGKTPTPGAC